MNQLRTGIMGLAGVFAAMLVCGCSPDKFIVRGESGASVLSVDTHGFIRITGPIATEVPLESEDLAEHAGRGEFFVRNGNGQNVARVDGRTGNLYLLGQLERVPQLEASALPEFVVTDAAGTAVALIDAYGNLKYRGRIGMLMTRTVSSTEYTPCGTLEVTVTLYYYDAAPIKALGLREGFPEGWTYVERVSGVALDVKPSAGEGSVMDFAWVTAPEFPVTFTYRVRAPQNTQAPAQILGQGRYRTDGPEYQTNLVVTSLTEEQDPDGEISCEGEGEQLGMQAPGEGTEEGGGSLDFMGDGEGATEDEPPSSPDSVQREEEGEPCGTLPTHSADQNQNWSINLTELLRAIQFFNLHGYQCAVPPESTEDCYVPGPGDDHGCTPHESDYTPQDWAISLTELLRLIQFFNIGGYHVWQEGEDGFAPGMLVRNGQDLAIQLRVDFEDLDDDSSGGLTFEEARGVGKQAVGILDLTQGDFDQIDQDQNGELSGEELDLCSRALGVNWNELQHDVPWVNATSSPHVSFNGQLWVFGHWDEIWHSPDGIVWTLAEETTPWGSRGNGTCVVHNGMIWRMGGFDSYNWEEKNDVWYSSDGTTWTEATGAAPWNARWFHSSVVFDGKLWIMGGLAHDNLNDVWYSADGMNWTEATSAAPWCPRDGHSSVVFAGKMWLMGGWASNKVELNDVWSSSDGTNWTEVTNAASWIGRYDFASLVHEGKIWILGGSGDWSHGSYLRNDVWNSSDGLNWTQVTAAAQWSPRDQLTALVHDEKMIVMGGYSEDIWKGFTYSLGPPGEWRRQQRQWIDEKLEESNDDVWREGVGVEVMLTFDDGPHAAPPDGGSNRTQKVLNTLANYTRNGKSQSVKVTFFVQTHARDGEGQYYRGMHPNGREMLKRIDAAGHEIGIHTGSEQDHAFHWQRATLANNTTETEPYDINEPEYWPADGNPDGRNALASDLIRAKAFLEWLPDTDITPNWVRPPGGETWWDSDPEPSPNIVKETYGYYADPQVEPILYLGPKKFGGAYETGSNWHVDSGDSAEGATLQQVIENLGKRIPKKLLNHTKVVILFHDINEVTSEGSPPNTNLKQYLDTIWDVLDANGRVPTFVVLPDPPFPEALSPSS